MDRKDVTRPEFYSENIKLHKGVEIMLKKRKLGSLGGCSLSSDAGYEFCHSFCSRRDNRVCAKDVCIFLGAGATGL